MVLKRMDGAETNNECKDESEPFRQKYKKFFTSYVDYIDAALDESD